MFFLFFLAGLYDSKDKRLGFTASFLLIVVRTHSSVQLVLGFASTRYS